MRMIWEIFKGDFRHLFRNVIAAIVVVGLILVPPLYAWFTTLGFWDPYDNTGNIKVAVSSQDEGYASELMPMRINAGDQIISKLRANDQFDWQFVDADQALDGVQSGEYYAALVIPKEFSADLMTVFSGDIKDPQIIYYDNEKENAIAQRVTATGASTLRDTIDEAFTAEVASVALDTTSGLTTFISGDGIVAYAHNLLSSIDAAISELSSSSDQVEAYANLLASTSKLVEASAKVLKDASDAPDAVSPLIEDARVTLSDVGNAISASAEAADAALSQANESFDAVSSAAEAAFDTMRNDPAIARAVIESVRSDIQGLIEAYSAMRDALEAAAPGSQAVDAANRVIAQMQALDSSLGSAADAIQTDATQIEAARAQVTDAINQAREALDASRSAYNDQLKGELASLSSTMQQVGEDAGDLASSLRDTTSRLSNSADPLGSSLKDAEEALRKTAETLRTANQELSQARNDLEHALNTGDIEEVRRIIGNNPEAIAQFLAAPTHLERHAVYPMANNGSAMSPFYSSLCLWIGAIFSVALMNVQVSSDRKRKIRKKTGKMPTQAELYLGRYGVFAFFGLAQALVLGLGNVFFLGVECEHFWLYMLALCVASIVFSNLVYTLTVSFGNIGKAIAIILLVLQLGGAGGLMPVQMLASFFQAMYPWLPFAHSMEAMQGAMAGIYGNHYIASIGLLLAFLLPSLALGLVFRRPVIKLNNWVLRKLDETKFI